MSPPGVKGEPGPAGLPGNRVDVLVIFIQIDFHI
jgi:hypothetical protein